MSDIIETVSRNVQNAMAAGASDPEVVAAMHTPKFRKALREAFGKKVADELLRDFGKPDRIAQIDAANDEARLALDALRAVIEDLPDSSRHGPTLILISERLEQSWDKIEDLCMREAP